MLNPSHSRKLRETRFYIFGKRSFYSIVLWSRPGPVNLRNWMCICTYIHTWVFRCFQKLGLFATVHRKDNFEGTIKISVQSHTDVQVQAQFLRNMVKKSAFWPSFIKKIHVWQFLRSGIGSRPSGMAPWTSSIDTTIQKKTIKYYSLQYLAYRPMLDSLTNWCELLEFQVLWCVFDWCDQHLWTSAKNR